jgi:hypothetical protein
VTENTLKACTTPNLRDKAYDVSDEGPFRYRRDVLLELERHGVRPTAQTSPELVRGYVRDLYKYEIRALRERYLRAEFPKKEYSGRVDELRRRYSVLALLPRQFIE